ncbi:3',5'-cyclic-nucleotide phosphodiesterase [Methylobacterium planeticum]|nr:3',5'-cyclic-nucleotide phosphodiesterase [Methylobacterium planeticum]
MTLIVVGPALAQTTLQTKRGNENLRKYCTGDALSFCSGIDPDDKKMDSCFKEHRSELSENCRRAIDAYQASGGK